MDSCSRTKRFVADVDKTAAIETNSRENGPEPVFIGQ